MNIIVENIKFHYRIRKKKTNFYRFFSYLYPSFEEIEALKNISFEVNHGEKIGIVGKNGAGKSTLIKLLTGIMAPDDGIIKVGHFTPHKDNTKFLREISVMWGNRSQLWWDLSPIETYKLYAAIYGLDNKSLKMKVDMVVEKFSMEGFWNKPVRKLSLGQRMRAEIGLCLLSNPKIIFLDEPTISLDFMVKKNIRDFLKKWAIENKITIILTSHDLKDVSDICDRLIVLDNGMIKYDNKIDHIEKVCKKYRKINLSFRNPVTKIDLENLPFIKYEWRSRQTLTGFFDNTTMPKINIENLKGNNEDADIQISYIDLEDILSMGLIG